VDARPGRPVRIATVGFQGFGNDGDEAILSGIEAILAGSAAEVTTVFCGPNPESIAAFPAARRMTTARHLPTPAAWRAIRGVDLLVLAGGGILNDHWTLVVPRYVAWTIAARLAGARVAWVGVGVGPIRRRPLRWLARLGACAASPVLVRDAQSVAILGAAGRPRVIPDPSLFNRRPARTDEGTVGLVVRAPTAADAADEPRLVEALVELADLLAERDTRTMLLTMGGAADDAFLARLKEAFGSRGRLMPPIEALGPDPWMALDRLARLHAVVAVRLHGVLLAVLAGVPVVPISYDAKVQMAAERLGLAEQTVPLHAVDASTLLAQLDAAGRPGVRAETERRLAALRAEGPAVAAAIVRAGGRR
jgi:polysaccharide pyruvyl transferase WcaK-like protein